MIKEKLFLVKIKYKSYRESQDWGVSCHVIKCVVEDEYPYAKVQVSRIKGEK